MDRKLGGIAVFLAFSGAFAQSPTHIRSFPALHNSPDTVCQDQVQCTNAEFQQGVLDLRRRWALAPEVVTDACLTNHTLPSVEECFLRSTMQWLNQHPGTQAPWMQ